MEGVFIGLAARARPRRLRLARVQLAEIAPPADAGARLDLR